VLNLWEHGNGETRSTYWKYCFECLSPGASIPFFVLEKWLLCVLQGRVGLPTPTSMDLPVWRIDSNPSQYNHSLDSLGINHDRLPTHWADGRSSCILSWSVSVWQAIQTKKWNCILNPEGRDAQITELSLCTMSNSLYCMMRSNRIAQNRLPLLSLSMFKINVDKCPAYRGFQHLSNKS
jgi:hypothetical protein